MVPSTRDCTPGLSAGRRRKAIQFRDAFTTVAEFADEPGDVADVCVTLAVHAGVAAADVVCCAAMGRYHSGPGHRDAVELLRRVDPKLARYLQALLELKTLAGYSHVALGVQDLSRASRAMEALVDAAVAA